MLPAYGDAEGAHHGPTEVISEIAETYGKQHRMNRNMVLFLAPDSAYVANAIERAMDWKAAERVLENADLMARFTEKPEGVDSPAVDHQRSNDAGFRAESVQHGGVPQGMKGNAVDHGVLELSYTARQRNAVLAQAGGTGERHHLHESFNPALFDDRWGNAVAEDIQLSRHELCGRNLPAVQDLPILTSSHVLRTQSARALPKEPSDTAC